MSTRGEGSERIFWKGCRGAGECQTLTGHSIAREYEIKTLEIEMVKRDSSKNGYMSSRIITALQRPLAWVLSLTWHKHWLCLRSLTQLVCRVSHQRPPQTCDGGLDS